MSDTVHPRPPRRSQRLIGTTAFALVLGGVCIHPQYAQADDAPDIARITKFATEKCRQEIIMMSAMDGKSDAEKTAFCVCVGKQRAQFLMEKPEWAKKSHWRRKTYSRAIVSCSETAKTGG